MNLEPPAKADPRIASRPRSARFQAVCGAAVAALTVFGATLDSANAQSNTIAATAAKTKSLPIGEPYAFAFFKAMQKMLLTMRPGKCYEASGGPTPIAFVGIPPTNVHFNDALKSQINEFSKDSIKSFLPLSLAINDAATFETIAALATVNTEDQLQLSRAVRKIRNAPLVVVINAKRPGRDIAQLKIELFSRTASGLQDCPNSKEFFVRLDNFNVISRSEIDARFLAGEYVDGAFAFRHALRKSAGDIRNFSVLDVELDLAMNGSCRFAETAQDAFRSDFFSVERERRTFASDGRSQWPNLIIDNAEIAEPAAGDATATAASADAQKRGHMKLKLALFPAYNDVVDITLDVTQGNIQSYSTFFRMIATPDDLAGCVPLSKKPLVRHLQTAKSDGSVFRLDAAKRQFRAGRDPVEIEFSFKADQNVYCWIIDKNMDAYVLYPWREEQLSEPWKGGEKKVYPNDFDYKPANERIGGPIVYQDATREAFGCFSSRKRLKSDLEARWIDLHPRNSGGKGVDKSLTAREVRQITKEMRAQSGVIESYAWIEVID